MNRRDDTRDLDLFLDESGTFMETSTSPWERREAERSRRRFPSQLAGLLVPRDGLTRRTGRDALERIFRRVGKTAPESLHGMDLRPGQEFDGLVLSLVEEVDRRGWKPVRLTNREQVSYGDRVANYTNLVAELAIRLFQRQQQEGARDVALNFTCAVVKLGESADDLPILLENDEYLARLRETHARAAVRRGFAAESSGWDIASFRTGSARSWPELMLCDLISNASHDGFRKLGEEAKEALATSLGAFDFTLRIQELVERVDTHLDHQAFGPALVLLAERITEPDRGGPVANAIHSRITRILDELTEVGAPLRDPQLALVYTYLEQTIIRRRALSEGQRLASWLARKFLPPLRERLAKRQGEHTLDWFEYGLAHLQLSACNLRGDLGGGREFVTVMKERLPVVASRFEHTEIALSGLVSEAAHRLGCGQIDRSLELAGTVSRFFDDLGHLFSDAMQGTFPDRVRADLRGHALRVAMMASMYRTLLAGSDDYSEARAFGDAAIDEFDSPAEKREQYRFRCELEILAGDLDSALDFLARGVRAESASHEAVGAGIERLPEKSVARGIAILNWLRLGHALHDAADDPGGAEFLEAWRRSKLEGDSWCRGGTGAYPSHGVLRRLAELQAVEKRRDQAIASLSLLQDMVGPVKDSTEILAMLGAASAMRVAGRLQGAHPGHAKKLLDRDDRERPGAVQRLENLIEREDAAPARVQRAREWLTVCRDAVEQGNADSARKLLHITRRFPF